MSKTTQHTSKSILALLFLAAFMSSLFIKPFHSLFTHHELSESVKVDLHEQAVTTDNYKDCPICDFEFCTFIPQKTVTVPPLSELIQKEQTVYTVACLARISSYLFQLRAPPTL